MNRRDDIGMAVSGGHDGDACGEIEEHVAVNVSDRGALTGFRDQRISACVGGRNIFVIQLQDFFCLRAGERSDQLG